jgi:putative transposase
LDITKLLGPVKWIHFYIYVILDIISRNVVEWTVADREIAELAKRLIADTCRKQNIPPNQLSIHADCGTSMTSKPFALLLADLGSSRVTVRPTSLMTTRSRKIADDAHSRDVATQMYPSRLLFLK